MNRYENWKKKMKIEIKDIMSSKVIKYSLGKGKIDDKFLSDFLYSHLLLVFAALSPTTTMSTKT